MTRAWLAVPFLLMPVAATAGDTARRPPSPSSPPTADVFLGYSFAHAGAADLHGWQLSGTYPLRGALRLVADLDGHYGSFAQADLRQLSLLAGARWVWTRGRVGPFAEALIGGVRSKATVALPDGRISDSDTDWGGALGGGVDYRFGRRWAARARLDLLLLRGEGSWDSDPRICVGLVYRFGV